MIQNKNYRNNERGFTIIELLVATTVFSVILLLSTGTLIQISRLYYKGIVQTKTQNSARLISDDVSRSTQFSGSAPIVNGSFTYSGGHLTYSFCVGQVRYTYHKNVQLSKTNDIPNRKSIHVLWRDKPSGACGSNIPDLAAANPSPTTGGYEMLNQGMRLGELEITNPITDIYAINTKVFYGDSDVINFDGGGNPQSCKGVFSGAQWCAFSGLSTEVYRRVQ